MKFSVEIIEILQTVIKIDALTSEEAIKRPEKVYRDKEFGLNSEDNIYNSFTIKEKGERFIKQEKLLLSIHEQCELSHKVISSNYSKEHTKITKEVVHLAFLLISYISIYPFKHL